MTIALGFTVAGECALIAQVMWLARSIDALASGSASAHALTLLGLASAAGVAFAAARNVDVLRARAGRSLVPLTVARLLGPIVAAFLLSPASGCAAAAALAIGALAVRQASVRLAYAAAKDAAARRSGQEALRRALADANTRDRGVLDRDALAAAGRDQARATRGRVSAALRVDICREGMAGAVLAIVALSGRALSLGGAVALGLVALTLLAGIRELTAGFVALPGGVGATATGFEGAVTEGGQDERRTVV